MKRLIFFFGIFICVTSLLISQEKREVYAPFVSNLEVVADVNRVVLSWNDSPDAIPLYRIYRSADPFSRNGEVDDLLIGTVASGLESFSYSPDSTEPSYYAVLGVDQTGQEYRLYIPYRNISSESVSIDTVAGIEERATKISNLKHRVSGELVYLSYESSKINRPILVYRSTAPILDETSLREANQIASLNSSGGTVTDFPLPGLDYYYAVIDSELKAKGIISISPGDNSTTSPATIRLPSSYSALTGEERSSRIRPLPFLTLPKAVSSGDYLSDYEKYTLPPYTQLSEESSLSARKLLSSLPGIELLPQPKTVILPLDKVAGEDPEAILLYDIVNGPFKDQQWQGSEKALGNFLAVRRSKALEARGHFYMGQSYFFQDRLREAFMEFLFSRDFFYDESQEWIDIILSRLAD
jgi:hypothetical protein